MGNPLTGKIMAGQSPDLFAGRTEELEQIVGFAGDRSFSGIQLSFAPRSGATELLLQAYDKLFRERTGVVPAYFSLAESIDAESAARRFAVDVLTQLVACRRNDPELLYASLSLSELTRYALPGDADFIDSLTRTLDEPVSDDSLFVRKCLSVPVAAGALGQRMFVMLDDLHFADRIKDGHLIISALNFLSRRPGFPFLTAAYRRSRVFQYDLRRIELPAMSAQDISQYIDAAAAEFGCTVSDSVRDLLRLVVSGDVAVIRGIIRTAGLNSLPLQTYRDLGAVYSAAVFGGTVSSIYNRILARACGDASVERSVIRLIRETWADAGSRPPVEVWQRQLGLDKKASSGLIAELHREEVIRAVSHRIEPMTENRCLADYISVRYDLEIDGKGRAAAFADFLAGFVKRAPEVMEEEYRRASAIGLRELLASFDAKQVPLAFFDYERFKTVYKGLPQSEIKTRLRADNDLLKLPKIVFSAHTESFYKAIGLVTESERSAVAIGFETAAEKPDEQIAWIAAEIDSKLEANAELAGFWCDRLEMAAHMCGFERFRLWLISPEGFSEEALALLRERSCYSSSRRQAELLRDHLNDNGQVEEEAHLEEYEIVIPMGDDAEMVAAHALEDIAKRHNFGVKEINQIKTALVEACINAAEHSHSLDRRIHQKFVVGPGHITITVSNRGIRLIDKRNSQPVPDEGRRGWGLKLMRQLMDEVRIEQVDDGTRISMTKYLSIADAA